jgi:hypothetical protein
MLKDPVILNRLARIMPVFDWGRRYDRDALGNDLVAAVIVTIMLIPQSLAYALLAGLPPKPASTPRSRRSCFTPSSAPAGRWPSGRWRWSR